MQKPTGLANGLPVYHHYDWSCVHCEKRTLEDLPTLPFQNFSFSSTTDSDAQEEESVVLQPVFPKGNKLLYQNINGLKSKFIEIKKLLFSENNVLLLGLSETKLQPRDLHSQYEITGYSMLRYDRISGEGGGTIIYVNDSCDYEILDLPLSELGNIECNVVSLKLEGTKPIIVCVVYVPPKEVNESMFKHFLNLCSFLRCTGNEVVIMGDFNIDLMQRSHHTLKLRQISEEFDFTQKVKFPTRVQCRYDRETDYVVTSTLLDHIYTNQPNMYSSVLSNEFAGSDHKMIGLQRKKCKIRILPRVIEYRCYRSIDQNKLSTELIKLSWKCLKYAKDAGHALDMFENVVLAVLVGHAPLKKRVVKGHVSPWFTNVLASLCKVRDSLKTRFTRTKDPVIYNEYKAARNKANTEICRAKRSYFTQKFTEFNDSTNVWNFMNELINYRSKCTTKIVKLVTNSGIVAENDEDLCSELSNNFIISDS